MIADEASVRQPKQLMQKAVVRNRPEEDTHIPEQQPPKQERNTAQHEFDLIGLGMQQAVMLNTGAYEIGADITLTDAVASCKCICMA